MEIFEALKDYGVLGGLIAFFGISIKLNVAELIFYNEFDRLFWSKSRKSISQMMSLTLSFIGIFLIVFFLGTLSVLLSDWLIFLLKVLLSVVISLYYLLILSFIIKIKNKVSDFLKKYIDIMSTIILVVSCLVIGNGVYEQIGGIDDLNSFKFTNELFFYLLSITYLLLVFVHYCIENM